MILGLLERSQNKLSRKIKKKNIFEIFEATNNKRIKNRLEFYPLFSDYCGEILIKI